ncbi:hypothetical protein [Anaeromicrobium sediminis]|uniref:Uncharacterized protein n=1 Tax=Anaeromicrobium sediminis TaxID=1478221 RepID=A0A267MIH4_9FIRM|nr:hypothetical protein [Anaeromicrobium sediminis]PAB59247.1 hypothetical protein CCE28_10295 [Anaeromicrobium sediminis]
MLYLDMLKDDPYLLDNKYTVVKKTIKLRAFKTNEEIKILTIEGNLMVPKGHYVVVGIFGELYPSAPEHFERKHDLVDDKVSDIDSVIGTYKYEHEKDADCVDFSKEDILNWNVYRVKYMELIGVEAQEDVLIDCYMGKQYGKKGDFIIINNKDYFYICNRHVFDHTYDILKRVEKLN